MSDLNDSQDLFSENIILYQCVFCVVNLDECVNPKILPCLHGACSACISAHEFNDNDETFVKCKACKKAGNIKHIIDNVFVFEKNEEYSNEINKTHTCDICQHKPLASAYCYNCQDWLCEICVQMHARVKFTNCHFIKSIEEMKDNSNTSHGDEFSMCSNHMKEQLDFYCLTCEKLTCRDCQLLDHKGHDYELLANTYIMKKKWLCQMIPKLKQKKDKINYTFKLTKLRHEDVSEQQILVGKEIRKFEAKLIAEIKKRSMTLLQQLEDLCLEEKTKLQMNMDTLLSFSQSLQNCKRVAEISIDSIRELNYVYASKTINFRTKNLLNKQYQKIETATKFSFYYDKRKCIQMTKQMGELSIDDIPIDAHILLGQHDDLPSISNKAPSLPLISPDIETEQGNRTDIASSYIQVPQQHYDKEISQIPQSLPDRSINGSQAFQQHSKKGAPTLILKISSRMFNENSDLLRHFNQGVPQVVEKIPHDCKPQLQYSSQGATQLPQKYPIKSLNKQGISLTPVDSTQSRKQSASHRIQDHTSIGFTQGEVHVDTTIAPSVNPISNQVSNNNFDENLDTISNTFANVVKMDNSEHASSTHSNTHEECCSLCKTGGMLICCSNCPRTYHTICHIPPIAPDAKRDWTCIMCKDLMNYSLQNQQRGMKRENGLNDMKFSCCQRILAEIFCFDKSDPFILACSQMAKTNPKNIYEPMTLRTIKNKLDKANPNFYQNVDEFLADFDLYFMNCQKFFKEKPLLLLESLNLNYLYIALRKKFLPGLESSAFNPDQNQSPKKAKMSNE